MERIKQEQLAMIKVLNSQKKTPLNSVPSSPRYSLNSIIYCYIADCNYQEEDNFCLNSKFINMNSHNLDDINSEVEGSKK